MKLTEADWIDLKNRAEEIWRASTMDIIIQEQIMNLCKKHLKGKNEQKNT